LGRFSDDDDVFGTSYAGECGKHGRAYSSMHGKIFQFLFKVGKRRRISECFANRSKANLSNVSAKTIHCTVLAIYLSNLWKALAKKIREITALLLTSQVSVLSFKRGNKTRLNLIKNVDAYHISEFEITTSYYVIQDTVPFRLHVQ
jgi:hypothetical protein